MQLVLALATMAASVPNGLTSSPMFDSVLFLLRPFVPAALSGPDAQFYLTGVFTSAMTLALAGVPAALFERLRGAPASTIGSLLVWLAAALGLGAPGILGLAGYYSIE